MVSTVLFLGVPSILYKSSSSFIVSHSNSPSNFSSVREVPFGKITGVAEGSVDFPRCDVGCSD